MDFLLNFFFALISLVNSENLGALKLPATPALFSNAFPVITCIETGILGYSSVLCIDDIHNRLNSKYFSGIK